RLGGGRAAVDADKTLDNFTGSEGCRDELLVPVLVLETLQIGSVFGQTACAAALGLLFFPADGHVPFELVPTDVATDLGIFGLAEFDGADGGKILGVIGRADQVLRRNALGKLGATFFPDFRDVMLPAVAHALDVAVGPA